MALFTAHLTMPDGHHHIDYESIDACLADQPLMNLLDAGQVTVVLWAGSLRLTGTPLQNARALRQALVENSKTILGRIL